MSYNRPYIVRMQTTMKATLSAVAGNVPKGATKVRQVDTHIYNSIVPFHFQAHAHMGEDKFKRIYVEFDERVGSNRENELGFKLAFVPVDTFLGQVTWQHHTFSTKGHGPEAAGSVIAGYAAAYFYENKQALHADIMESLRIQQG